MTDNSAAASPRWEELSRLDDLPVGEMTAVDIGRHSILLVRTSDEVNAYQNICPHERYRLNDGTFNDGVVTCPGHNWCFDARTGQGIRPRGARLQRYNARVADGRIEIALP